MLCVYSQNVNFSGVLSPHSLLAPPHQSLPLVLERAATTYLLFFLPLKIFPPNKNTKKLITHRRKGRVFCGKSVCC
eukprot:m.13750 g.13750  ORF g.13750 m.13750 type:complete len:76 (+) comp7594_c0_seq1:198-425(+)